MAAAGLEQTLAQQGSRSYDTGRSSDYFCKLLRSGVLVKLPFRCLLDVTFWEIATLPWNPSKARSFQRSNCPELLSVSLGETA